MRARPHRPPIRGLDPWKTVGGRRFTYWDLWLLVLVVTEGGFDAVAQKLGERHRTPGGWAADDSEAKLSHLAELRERVAKLELDPNAVVGAAANDKKVLAKARTKIVAQEVEHRDKSAAMVETPRRKFRRRATRGYWDRFPVSPRVFEAYLPEIAQYHDLDGSFRLARRLERAREKAGKKVTTGADELALWRAMLTAWHDAMDHANDSCGVIGAVGSNAIRKYAAVAWETTGIAPEVYIRDAVEFATWEEYGLGDEMARVFKRIDRRHAELADRIFEETIDELSHYCLFQFQIDQALDHWASLLVGQRRFDAFEKLAMRIGSSQWMPIVRLAEAAWKTRKRDVALAVFAAANVPGPQQRHLAEQCVRITGEPPPRPKLRLVK